MPLKISETGGPKNAMWMKKYEYATATAENSSLGTPDMARGGVISALMMPIFISADRLRLPMAARPVRSVNQMRVGQTRGGAEGLFPSAPVVAVRAAVDQ